MNQLQPSILASDPPNGMDDPFRSPKNDIFANENAVKDPFDNDIFMKNDDIFGPKDKEGFDEFLDNDKKPDFMQY
jgi:hypothetical protein